MFKSLKNKAIIKRYEKVLASQAKNFNPDIDHGVKTVGVITDDLDIDTNAIIKNLAKLLQIKEASISVIFYSEKEIITQDKLFFTPKNLDWSGKINSDAVSQFVYYPFDLLINYSHNTNTIVNMVVAMAKAKFKVGYEAIDNRLYQFMLSQNAKDIFQFNKELIRYLKIMQVL